MRCPTRAPFAIGCSTWSRHSRSRTTVSPISATWFTRAELPILERLIGDVDTLIICRTRYSARFDSLVIRARAAGCRVLFDVDDLIFDMRYVSLVLETLDRNPGEPMLDEWFAAMSRLGAMLRLCDGAISTNHFLSPTHRGVRAAADMGRPQFSQRPAAGAIGGGPPQPARIRAA